LPAGNRGAIARLYLPRRCAKSDAAALFAAFDAVLEVSVLPAAEAAGLLVCFAFLTCARSEAAALFAAFEAELEFSVLPAADAALGLVRPELAIVLLSGILITGLVSDAEGGRIDRLSRGKVSTADGTLVPGECKHPRRHHKY
jgi:hypothetical protein